MAREAIYDTDGNLVTEVHLRNRIILDRLRSADDKAFLDKNGRPRQSDEPPERSWHGSAIRNPVWTKQPPADWTKLNYETPTESPTWPAADEVADETRMEAFKTLVQKLPPLLFPCSIAEFCAAMNKEMEALFPAMHTFNTLELKGIMHSFETHVTFSEELGVVRYRMRPFTIDG